jgi:DNA-binding transcriptional LysR family regulator
MDRTQNRQREWPMRVVQFQDSGVDGIENGIAHGGDDTAGAQGCGVFAPTSRLRVWSGPPLLPILSDWKVVAPPRLSMIHPDGLLTPKGRAFRDHMKAEFGHPKASMRQTSGLAPGR